MARQQVRPQARSRPRLLSCFRRGVLTILVALITGEDLPLGRTFAYDAGRDRKRAALTVAEVNQAVRKHLAPDKLVIIRAGDFKK